MLRISLATFLAMLTTAPLAAQEIDAAGLRALIERHSGRDGAIDLRGIEKELASPPRSSRRKTTRVRRTPAAPVPSARSAKDAPSASPAPSTDQLMLDALLRAHQGSNGTKSTSRRGKKGNEPRIDPRQVEQLQRQLRGLEETLGKKRR